LGAGLWRIRWFVVAWTCSDRIWPRATVVAPCLVPLAVLAARRSAAEELRVCLVAPGPQSANAVAPPLPTSRPAARNHAPAAIRLREEVKSSLPPHTTVGPQIRQSWNCGMKLRHKMHRRESMCRRCRRSSCSHCHRRPEALRPRRRCGGRRRWLPSEVANVGSWVRAVAGKAPGAEESRNPAVSALDPVVSAAARSVGANLRARQWISWSRNAARIRRARPPVVTSAGAQRPCGWKLNFSCAEPELIIGD
jgi:hypothetical protein